VRAAAWSRRARCRQPRCRYDGTIRLRNSDGDHVVQSSSANRLAIAGLVWDAVPFAVADNMTRREDALIGNGLFQDKVVEIDYDRMVLAIHDALPPLDSSWVRQDLVLDGGVVPFTRGTLRAGGSDRAGWFMLDTGAYTSILNDPALTSTAKFAGELRRLVGLHATPLSVSIGGQHVDAPNYSVRRYDGDGSSLGLLGNDVLKRFNLILDNRQGAVYFRPNGQRVEGFRNPERVVVRTAAAVALSMAAACTFLLVRPRRREDEASLRPAAAPASRARPPPSPLRSRSSSGRRW
jgi:hypothetical protein